MGGEAQRDQRKRSFPVEDRWDRLVETSGGRPQARRRQEGPPVHTGGIQSAFRQADFEVSEVYGSVRTLSRKSMLPANLDAQIRSEDASRRRRLRSGIDSNTSVTDRARSPDVSNKLHSMGVDCRSAYGFLLSPAEAFPQIPIKSVSLHDGLVDGAPSQERIRLPKAPLLRAALGVPPYCLRHQGM
jgi:hypothetical protein